jgi:trimeric autotransporter adhesin
MGQEVMRSRGLKRGVAVISLAASLLVLATASARASHVKLVRDINPGSADSDLGSLTKVGGKLFFTAEDRRHGLELWRSDGTRNGTKLVRDIAPGGLSSDPTGLTNADGTLFFSAENRRHRRALWRSDGTRSGTRLVRHIVLGPGSIHRAPEIASVGGTAFFINRDSTHGRELWRSDGTRKGTKLVRDIKPGTGNMTNGWYWSPVGLTNVGGTLFFRADDGTHGRELWRSDGTRSGTKLVRDIYPGASSDPYELTDVAGTLFFSATDGRAAHGRELWRSDGTAAGTTLVRDIYPTRPFAGNSSRPSELTDLDGTLFFSAHDGTHGGELWRSDGTAAGTTLVRDIRPGCCNFGPHSLTNVGGTLYFGADDGASDGTSGDELWRSDGTAAGTVKFLDLFPSAGDGAGIPRDVGGTLFFNGHDDTHGWELWRSDGTDAGTRVARDINPGTPASFPGDLTNVAGTLFFTAADGTHGRELWKAVP